MQSGIDLGRIFGIHIRIDWSWFLIFFLITWNLGTSFFALHPEWGAIAWITAIVAALLFFISVLAHELAHSLMARAQGIPVRNITLFLFGGVANIQREPQSPRAEFLITIVGPIASFVIGFALLSLAGLNTAAMETLNNPEAVVRQLTPLTTLLLWLGSVNVTLALFNLIPGFPLDGGRVLRSILWAATNNLRRATRWASWVGQAVAWLFIIGGVLMIFGGRVPVFGGGVVNGLWLVFIGWFLNNAAVQSYQQVVVQDLLDNVPVARMMRSNPPTVTPNISIQDLIYSHVMGTDDYAFPVIEAQQLVGIVTLEDIRAVPREEWFTRSVYEIMTPMGELVVASPEEDAAHALRKLMERDVRQLPVMRAGQLVGLLRRRDIMRWLQLQSDTFA